MAVPGVFIVIVLFLSRQIELAVLLLFFDIIGTAGGIWWLSFSRKLAKRAHAALTNNEASVWTPSRVLKLFAVAIVAVCILWGMVMLVKVTAGNVVSLRCLLNIPQQTWMQFGECIKAGGNCTNPLMVCTG